MGQDPGRASLAICVSNELNVIAARCVCTCPVGQALAVAGLVCVLVNRLRNSGLGAGMGAERKEGGIQVLQCCPGARRRRGAALDAQTTPRAHLGSLGQSAWLGTLAALCHLHIYPPAPLCAGVCPSSQDKGAAFRQPTRGSRTGTQAAVAGL